MQWLGGGGGHCELQHTINNTKLFYGTCALRVCLLIDYILFDRLVEKRLPIPSVTFNNKLMWIYFYKEIAVRFLLPQTFAKMFLSSDSELCTVCVCVVRYCFRMEIIASHLVFFSCFIY